jgi:hypothetical protein
VNTGAILGGTGRSGPVTLAGLGALSPGSLVGRLTTGSITYGPGAVHALYLEGDSDGEYGQLAVNGGVTLTGAKFESGQKGAQLAPDARYVLIDNDGTDPIVGVFDGLAEGAEEPGPRWGVAEGRIGGPRNFDTYILLANPAAEKAQVRITYLRESGAPIVKQYEVSPTSRFNVDVKTMVPELQNSSFGATIEVLNEVSIVVERSLYWDARGAFWAGGTIGWGPRLPAVK